MPERALALALVFTLLMGGMIARLFQLQVLEGERYAVVVDDSRETHELIAPKRGRILDRHGVAIADNRAAYQVAVVLSALQPTRAQRRATPILKLDEEAFDRLIADLGVRLVATSQDELRGIVLRELSAHPAVAFRRGSETRDTALTLLTLPGEALAPVEDGSAEDASELATSDLVHEDPRIALAREVSLRWNEAAAVYLPEEIEAAAAALDRANGVAGARSLIVLDAFAPRVSLTIGDPPGTRRLEWRLLTEERRRQAEAALTRFLGLDPALVAERLATALAGARRPAPPTDCYFAASAQALEIAALLPKGAALYPVPLAGVPPARERVILIQGERAGEVDGLFARLQTRLGASLGIPSAVVGALIERHAARIRVPAAEREYRGRMVVLDEAKLARLCLGLSTILSRNGVPTTVLDLERAIAEARRIADKEWAGQGHDDPIVIVKDIPHRLALALERQVGAVPSDLQKRFDATEPALPGLAVQLASTREYPFGDSACHLIGTLSRIDNEFAWEEAVRRGLDPSGWSGKTGLERTYDSAMRGVVGRRVLAHGPEGTQELADRGQAAVPGRDLRTELDMEVQTAAEDALDHWYELAQQLGTADPAMDQARSIGRGRAGMAVIDCSTGGLLALASSPRFKIADLGGTWDELVKAPGEPLHDHASEASQPPGSALKILTALACLQHRIITPGQVIETKGYMTMVAGKKVLRSHAPAGSYDLAKAIQVSDNCYFATIGDRLGAPKLVEFFRIFGMGSRNALDVNHQRPGVLPDPAVQGKRWTRFKTWTLSIGQYSTASPLDVVRIAAAVANGGHVVTPYVVRPPGAPEVVDLDIRADYLEDVRRGMEQVTAPGGTAKYLSLSGPAEGIEVAAKTGTSEWGNPGDQSRFPDHSWLIGYAPADNPKIAFAIFIHSGKSGGRASSPVAKKVLEAYFAKYGRAGHSRIVDE
jgi:penicillin-binding protein 2